ncbi:MAG: PspC domain-containing protein [Mahellales bacterium]
MEKRLFRSNNQRVFGGVCGGIAEYFNVDVTLVRLIWIIVSIALLHVGGGILIYIIAWIIVPKASPYVETKDYTVDGREASQARQPGTAGTDTVGHNPDPPGAKAGVDAQTPKDGHDSGLGLDDEPYNNAAAQDTNDQGQGQTGWEDTQPGSPHHRGDVSETKNNGPMVIGLILIILGAFVIARRYLAPLWIFKFISWGNIWPILLIVIGLAIVIRGFSRRK